MGRDGGVEALRKGDTVFGCKEVACGDDRRRCAVVRREIVKPHEVLRLA
jgi:hypothetical protein